MGSGGLLAVIAIVVVALAVWNGGIGHHPQRVVTTSPTAKTRDQYPAWCRVGDLDRLVVRRTIVSTVPKVTFSFPATVVVKDPRSVQAVAKVACHLPPYPEPVDSVGCGLDVQLWYHLTFYVGTKRLRTIMASADCGGLVGLAYGSRGQWAGTPGNNTRFWSVLAAAMRVHPSAGATLGGTYPPGWD